MNYKKAVALMALVPFAATITSTHAAEMENETMLISTLTSISLEEKASANFLAQKGVIEDHSENVEMYNPDSDISRREMLKVMMNISGKTVTDSCTGKFSDLKSDDWGCKYAEAALTEGYIAANATFRPDAKITEAESLKMIMQAKGLERDENDDWRLGYSSKAMSEGIIDSKINLTANAKRGWIFESAANTYTDFDLSAMIDTMTPAVELNFFTAVDQKTTQYALVVKSVTVDRDSWVVVHRDTGENGPVVPAIISEPVMIKAGVSQNVQIMMKSGEKLTNNEKVWVMLHSDTGVTGEYEFDGKNGFDTPLKNNAGDVLTSSLMVEVEAGVEVGGSMMVPSRDIVANAMMANNVTTLIAAVKAAGLVETLQGTGPFTVFAPTNAAFEKLPNGTVTTLLLTENKAQLADILTYHVVAGAYTSDMITNGLELTTVQGEKLMFTIENKVLKINGSAMIETADVISSNGVTHVIDTVLMPSTK